MTTTNTSKERRHPKISLNNKKLLVILKDSTRNSLAKFSINLFTMVKLKENLDRHIKEFSKTYLIWTAINNSKPMEEGLKVKKQGNLSPSTNKKRQKNNNNKLIKDKKHRIRRNKKKRKKMAIKTDWILTFKLNWTFSKLQKEERRYELLYFS